MSIMRNILTSWRALPLWVQVWVGLVLVPVNVAAFFMLDTETGQYTAIAALFVALTNGPLMIVYQGMNRVLSLPHLVAWGPLVYLLALRLASETMATGEWIYAVLIVVVNGISLVFDLLDSWRWLRGERETPGLSRG